MEQRRGSSQDCIPLLLQWNIWTSGMISSFFKRVTINVLQKGVMISHRNVIANVLQICTFDAVYRDSRTKQQGSQYLENALGLLPMSHIYSLVVICHCGPYRGDGT